MIGMRIDTAQIGRTLPRKRQGWSQGGRLVHGNLQNPSFKSTAAAVNGSMRF
jgi:hypothetical protein